jgi:hypothetical protein
MKCSLARLAPQRWNSRILFRSSGAKRNLEIISIDIPLLRSCIPPLLITRPDFSVVQREKCCWAKELFTFDVSHFTRLRCRAQLCRGQAVSLFTCFPCFSQVSQYFYLDFCRLMNYICICRFCPSAALRIGSCLVCHGPFRDSYFGNGVVTACGREAMTGWQNSNCKTRFF